MGLPLRAILWNPHSNANLFTSYATKFQLTPGNSSIISIILSANPPPNKPEACKAFYYSQIFGFRSLLTALELTLSLRSEVTLPSG